MGIAVNKKQIGNAPLLGSPEKGFKLIIKDGIVGTNKLANFSVTSEKLSPEVLQMLQEGGKELVVDNKNATLAFGETTTVATVGNTDIKVQLPDLDMDGYVTVEDYELLLRRLEALENAQHTEPEEPVHTNPAYMMSTEIPTTETLLATIDPTAPVPTESITLDRNSYSGLTNEYIAYPKTWETGGHPAVIFDSLNFPQGLSPMDEDEENYYEDITVSGVVYVVRRVILNKGIYTLTF